METESVSEMVNQLNLTVTCRNDTSSSNDNTNRFQDNLGCSTFTVCNLYSPFTRDIKLTKIMSFFATSFPLITTISSRTVALIFSFHSTLFFLMKQLWGTMVKHESAVHVTQQVVARLPKSKWVCSCHQPCLAGPGQVERLKLFLCLHPPECLAFLDQGSGGVQRSYWTFYQTCFLLILITCLSR